MGTANHSNWQLRRKATPHFDGKPVSQMSRDMRTLFDHFMPLDEIAEHYGVSVADVRTELVNTIRVRRVM